MRDKLLLKDSVTPKDIDIHIHTIFSDGRSGLDDTVEAAMRKNLKIIAITDHYSELQPLAKRLSKSHLQGYLEALEEKTVLKGVEAEIFADGTPSISRKTVESLDIVLGGLHILHDIVFWHDSTSILNQKRFIEVMRMAFEKCMETHLVDIIAHVTWLPENIRSESTKLITDDWLTNIVTSASDHGVAIELSSAWNVPNEIFIKECIH